MDIFLFIVTLISGAFLGIIVQSIINYKQKKKLNERVLNEANTKQNFTIDDLQYLSTEWKTNIETQMHFNDLIIRFRSIVLSVFVAGLGLIYGISKQISLDKKDTYPLIGLALIFWICCFILDYFYYHKLLLGAVKSANKFDDNIFLKEKGFFGLTARISEEVNPLLSKILIWTFYLLPILSIIVLVILKQYCII